MMDYNYMMGGTGETMMIFAWTTHLLVTVLLVLSIVALWKYINKK